MNKIARLLLAPIAALTLTTANAHAAASIAGDSFDTSITFELLFGGTETVGPLTGTAGAVDDGFYPSAAWPSPAPDILQDVNVDGVDYLLGINWVDANSFELFINAFGATDINNLTFTLSGLNFAPAGLPSEIIGASFNRVGSILDENNPGGRPGYQAGSQMPSPSVSFTANSVTATFGFIPAALAADGPVLRFDVQATAVPEPSTLVFATLGIVVVGALARRRTRRIS